MNILAFHPETYKAPKKLQEFSLLTSNQAPSLVHSEVESNQMRHVPSREDHLDEQNTEDEYRDTGYSNPNKKFYRSSKSSSKIRNYEKPFRTTMPTVREEGGLHDNI